MKDQFESFHRCHGPVKHGLPAVAYTSDQFAEIENRTVFSSSWVFVGFAHELEKTGDVQPITVAGKPLFLVRNNDNAIAAFHNVCRHRGLKLVDSRINIGRTIKCPYHCWSYDLNGALRTAPYFAGPERSPPEGFVFEEHGLVPVACRTWHDWIFVNIDGSAQEFERFLEPLRKRMEDIDLDRIQPVASLDFGIVETNWKLLMENFIEPYHVQFVHRETTSQPLRDHRTIVDRHCLGSACDIVGDKNVDPATTLAVTSRYLTLFPNFVLGTYAPDQVGVHLNIPLAPGRTQQRRAIYFHRDSPASAREIEQTRALWHRVHREDHAICERLQLGRASDVAVEGGVLSPHWENSVRRFQELVVESVAHALP